MTGEPSLCIRGCGFFSTSQTKNLCSKCYNDFLKDESARYLATFNVNTKAAEEVTAQEATVLGSKGGCACKKKVGLLGFHCRCGHLFFASHRYPEEHSCPSDYKSAAIDVLAKQNPVVKGDKLFRL
ncbi:A20/AN1-like zinc finger family protein [Arabidopsis thaliana]|uniref:Putative zinc finger A20 and AN1 domain-containing stress-associated protein 8 n=1 Tax=Arabidopsis thaliana TaxID=3702 RepID=SAP8_ARATH|nr:A20/AN1-like zinc finger family protein [Arabidopsis thaliana]Q3EA33.1 RecName: Full=Putative zinc finger A20 and AN1 domain-containing stress-associated protein 8; Short=AtSAP8 [Arabidopsis thaliana]AEE83396.1 A20/AN1-like zinc finger family protein [Arabidopsis thaliana]|eukprot:NP_680686.1 A20/AN1-like zinc finger family protein [Arabidopsis thaliana]